jgi:hypothetical protein
MSAARDTKKKSMRQQTGRHAASRPLTLDDQVEAGGDALVKVLLEGLFLDEAAVPDSVLGDERDDVLLVVLVHHLLDEVGDVDEVEELVADGELVRRLLVHNLRQRVDDAASGRSERAHQPGGSQCGGEKGGQFHGRVDVARADRLEQQREDLLDVSLPAGRENGTVSKRCQRGGGSRSRRRGGLTCPPCS